MLRRCALICFAVLLGAAWCAQSVCAAGADGIHEGLGVEPAIVLQAAKPGSTFTVQLRLTNSTSKTLHVSTGAVAARGSSDVHSLVNIDTQHSNDGARNASSWLKFPPRRITLAAGADTSITVTVAVPANARPGVHAVLAMFSVPTTSAGAGGAGVSGTAGLAATMLLEVPGDAASSARIVKSSGPSTISAHHTGTFAARVENTGDTLLHLDAEVRLDAPWSTVRVLRTNEQLLLPGGQRDVRVRYTDPPLIGRYTPQLIVVGGSGSHVRVTRDLPALWVLPPWWLAVIIALALIAAIAGVRAHRRAR